MRKVVLQFWVFSANETIVFSEYIQSMRRMRCSDRVLLVCGKNKRAYWILFIPQAM